MKIKIARVGNTVLASIDGELIQKQYSELEDLISDYERCLNTDNPAEIKNILGVKTSQIEINFKEKKEKEIEKLNESKVNFDLILKKKYEGKFLFVRKDNLLYMKGIGLSIPLFLAKEIEKADGDMLKALVNFWKLCSMNSDPRAREDLFQFLRGGKFTLTSNGYFVAYRNVKIKSSPSTNTNSRLAKYVRNLDNEKMKSANPIVIEYNGQLLIVNELNIINKLNKSYINHGRLNDILNSVNQVVYTDARTGTFNIRIGELVKMERKKCDSDPNHDCSYGLHVGNKSFLSKGYFGNEGIAVLVNPSKVVAVPKYNNNKMRVCEYLPVGVVEYDSSGNLVEIDTKLYENNYCDYDVNELNKMIKKSGYSFEELKKNELIPYEMDVESLISIEKSLSDINSIIKSRVVEL